MGKKKNLHIIPIAIFVLCPTTFIVTYIFAVRFDHVSPALPYISDTGAVAPESCIFSQFLNISAFLLAICVYIRYLQIENFAHYTSEISHHLKANSIATVLGFLSCLGMDIVANFQVSSPVYAVHYFGALLCFWGGTAYFVFQTIFSYHMKKVHNAACVFYSRCVLCFLCILFNITAIIPGALASRIFGEHNDIDSNFWRPDQDGYFLYITSTISEWLLAISQSALVLTFLPEFRPLIIHPPKLKIQGLKEDEASTALLHYNV